MNGTFLSLRSLAFLLAVLALPACGAETKDPAMVDELRVLGVRADPPEAAPGDTAVLDALVVDPRGAGRTVDLAWSLCEIDPGGGTASCDDAARRTPIGTGATIALVLPDVLASLPPEAQDAGIDLFVALEVRAGEDAVPLTVKRVRVSRSAAPNGNPSIARFEIASAGLEAQASANSMESYADGLGEPTVEELKFAWFMTGGEMERSVTYGDDTGTSRVPWLAPEGGATLWVVMRDPRGGVAWAVTSVP